MRSEKKEADLVCGPYPGNREPEVFAFQPMTESLESRGFLGDSCTWRTQFTAAGTNGCPDPVSHPTHTHTHTHTAADECVAGVEAQSRRFFAFGFLVIRAWLDIVFALLFEVVTLLLHIARKVRIPGSVL